MSHEIERIIRAEFKKEHKQKTEALLHLISAPIHIQIEEKQREMELLKMKAQASEADKAKRLEEIEKKMGVLNNLMDIAFDLRQEISSTPVDAIAEQAL